MMPLQKLRCRGVKWGIFIEPEDMINPSCKYQISKFFIQEDNIEVKVASLPTDFGVKTPLKT